MILIYRLFIAVSVTKYVDSVVKMFFQSKCLELNRCLCQYFASLSKTLYLLLLQLNNSVAWINFDVCLVI